MYKRQPQQPVFYKGKKVTTFHDLTLLRVYNSDKNYIIFKAKQLVGRYVFKKVAKDSDQIITPVSYTHLDVYKRQDLIYTQLIGMLLEQRQATEGSQPTSA